MRSIAVLVLLILLCAPARAEDGYDLWLRYRPLDPQAHQRVVPQARLIVPRGSSASLRVAAAELGRGLQGLLGRRIATGRTVSEGAILLGTPASSPEIAGLRLPLTGLGDEGYVIRTTHVAGKRVTVIAANADAGLLYGTFAYLRLLQTRPATGPLDVRDRPKLELRMLDHWDNLDGSVERGYAGRSIWKWSELPDRVDPRYVDYARANASIGINAAALTNVNADARVLTADYLRKVAAIADALRPWRIRVYLTARFSAPIDIGGLQTADPLDARVRLWWRRKADEIYRYLPDFGGFLVKANSEGQPGPQDYGRSHADGANMLADTLAPHGGTVIWRAFVYRSSGEDRAKQAYDEFKPLDGRLRSNVVLQVKNGPIDFQPREPFHPLFGQMPHTRTIMEGQITKEYLGFATHLAYLGPYWEEVLDADTCAPRCGTPVARTITGMAGVANTGSARNWSGSHFDQANWYAFGRLAWNPDLPARGIAEEWVRMTWTREAETVGAITDMMMRSREAVVNYMTPLGLAHLMGSDHHYGPAPWVDDLGRPEWNPVYYHRANRDRIGFDRTATGSGAVGQYRPPVAALFGDRERVPERYLLWFHRVPWDHRLRSGETLWEALTRRYSAGVEQVRAMRSTWRSLRGKVDAERLAAVESSLATQEREAQWWRDASIAYFQSVAQRPLPRDVQPPRHPLSYYRSLRFTDVPGTPR